MDAEQLREFVKRSRGNCYLQAIKIGDKYVNKAFCHRCPKCWRNLPGMLANDGTECCINPRCDYERVVYTPKELELL